MNNKHLNIDLRKFQCSFFSMSKTCSLVLKYSACFVEKYWEVILRDSVTAIVCTQRASNWAENTDFGRRIITTGRRKFSSSILPRPIISDCLCLFSAPFPMMPHIWNLVAKMKMVHNRSSRVKLQLPESGLGFKSTTAETKTI